MRLPLFIRFKRRLRWGRRANNKSQRPYCQFTLHGPSGPVQLWGLVDTGADYLVLSHQVATAIGLNLSSATPEVTELAAGMPVTMYKMPVTVTFDERTLVVDALIGGGPTPLFGRVPILEFGSFGMDLKGWLYR